MSPGLLGLAGGKSVRAVKSHGSATLLHGSYIGSVSLVTCRDDGGVVESRSVAHWVGETRCVEVSLSVSLSETYGVFVLLGHDERLSGGSVSRHTPSCLGVSDHSRTTRLDSALSVGASGGVRHGVTVGVKARDAGSAGTGGGTAARKAASSGSGSGSGGRLSRSRLSARGGLSARGTLTGSGCWHGFTFDELFKTRQT